MSPTTPRSRTAAFGLSALAVLALSACSVADQTGGGSSEEQGSDAPKKTVTIMTHDSFEPPQELLEKFTEETGYELKTTAPGDAGTVVNQLLLAKDSPTVDGVYGVEDHSTHTLVDGGVLADVTPEDLPETAKDRVVDGKMIPIDQGQVCVNVDHEWFEDEGMDEPKGLEDLATPEYAELLVVTDPVTSSPGLAFLAATVEAEGEDGWQDWWTKALDGGTKVASSWSDAYYTDFSGGEGNGEYPLALSYSSSPAYAPTTGVVEGTCTPQTEFAGVVEGAKNPEGAQAFIEFMLSEEFQKAFPESMYMYPIDDSVELPEEWAEHAQLVEDPITPDSKQVAEQREQWLKDFTALREDR
ncbi:thiamine ABC transporter substrate binding subunit [Micrococcus luteus]